MSYDTPKIRGLMPSYSSFIAAVLNRLYVIFITGADIEKFEAVYQFIAFLPNEVKERLKPMLAQVDKDLDKIGIEYNKTRFTELYYMEKTRIHGLRRVSRRWARPLMMEAVRLLDSRGYLEVPSTRIGRKEFDEWEASLKEEEARVEG